MNEAVKIVQRLRDYLSASHACAVDNSHDGDEPRPGVAPESCSICSAVDDADQWLDLHRA